MQNQTIQKLLAISQPKQFAVNEYICFEGQPGDEMYIILQGTVGIFVSTIMDQTVEVARLISGDCFGEMAIFDRQPRSASCIALDNTICVAINKDNLSKFIETCPDLVQKIIETMSERIRKLNDELYKSQNIGIADNMQPFEIPSEYSFSHVVEEPVQDMKYTLQLKNICPVCGNHITVNHIKYGIISMSKIEDNMRVRYKEIDPLWQNIWECEHCGYSNHYQYFFRVPDFMKAAVKAQVAEERQIVNKAEDLKTPFDKLFLRYMRAIHINTLINSTDDLVTANLWMSLYWLFLDAGDPKMVYYCAENMISPLVKVFMKRDKLLKTDDERQKICMVLADAMAMVGRNIDAKKFYTEAAAYPNVKIKKIALLAIEQLK